jgi:molybdopterin molybdotransferase
MISRDKAWALVDQHLSGQSLPTQVLEIQQAVGRTVVEDQVSRWDIPPFDKSAVDGYAVPAKDDNGSFEILETVAAGQVPTQPLQPGKATKVMTGAPVPEGTDRVVMIEHVSESDGRIHINSSSASTNMCMQGENIRAEERVVSAPFVLSPIEMAGLISVGVTNVTVARPLRVAILATGDEIVDTPEALTPGKIMNSNGPMLAELCRKHAFDVVTSVTVADTLEATLSALSQGLAQADMVILSGGVSVGEFDYVAQAMETLGLSLHFDRVAIQPGKPTTFATGQDKVVFGLPGNPVAAFLMFYLFVLRAARLMTGLPPELRTVSLPLNAAYQRKKAERLSYLPCRLQPDGAVALLPYQGSGHLLALIGCDGFFVIPQDVTEISAGEKVEVLLIRDGVSS